MKQKSLKKNFALNLINTISGLLFPLITFPYASRILLAEGIGKIQFFHSIIDYIALFSALGIPLYAVREIARVRNDIKLSSKITIEILLLHTLLTLGGYVVVIILVLTVTKIQADITLFLLLSMTLFFSAIGVPWFYQAVEDFKYITIRTIVVRLVSLMALFIFVKSKSDLIIYAAITVIANGGANIFNFFRLRKYITTQGIKFVDLSLKRHLKASLKIFTLNLIVSVYINLDSIMLGFLKNEEVVGYYTAATRLTRTIIGVISSLGGVLLPRFSNMLVNNQNVEFQELARKSVSFIFGITLPVSVGMVCMASPIIHLFTGSDFEPSILTLQLISPIILFIGISNMLGAYTLFPLGQEKIVIMSTLAGAFISLILNFILIPHWAQYGAAISTSIAELCVLIFMVILGRKHLLFVWNFKQNMNYVWATIFMSIVLVLFKYFIVNEIYYLFLGSIVGIFVFLGLLFIKKDVLLLKILNILKIKF